jgi:hypothetical protein
LGEFGILFQPLARIAEFQGPFRQRERFFPLTEPLINFRPTCLDIGRVRRKRKRGANPLLILCPMISEVRSCW